MHTFVLETLILTMLARVEKGIEEIGTSQELLSTPSEMSKETNEYLHSYDLSKLSIATVVQWMHATGFRYKNQGKHFFVDGHKKAETLAYRPVFTKRYIAHQV